MSTIIAFHGRTRRPRPSSAPPGEGGSPITPLSRRLVLVVILFLLLAAL